MSLQDEFTEFLVEVCETDGSTTYVAAILSAARTAITNGGAIQSSLTSSGLNGKSFNRAVHLSAIEVARACQMALKIYAGTEQDVAATYGDFRELER